jgi:hypothetical protein
MTNKINLNSYSVAIIGSRTFNNYELVKSTMNSFDIPPSKIVSGGAIGADSLGAKYANEYNIPLLVYKPDWKKYGKSAGFLRNTDIIENSDIVVAFWDGMSNGTRDSINKATKLGKKVITVNF